MASRKGFTMLEIIVVLVIVGLLAALCIPSLMSAIEQSKAQSAKSNLLAIAAGQQKYFEDNNSYCTGSCGSTAAINTSLKLGISDPVNYSCSAVAGPPVSYSCAWNDGTDALTLAGTVVGGTVVGFNVTCVGSNCPS